MQSLDRPNERLGFVASYLNLTRKDLAERLGVEYNTICSYLTGGRVFKAKFAKKMEEVFRVSSAWLLKGEGEMFVPEEAPKEDNVSQMEQLVNKVDGIEKTLNEIKGLMEILVNGKDENKNVL